jgi:ATP-binding cassette subfamily B protein/subfamily B ATP-binding cassette protein MsbA
VSPVQVNIANNPCRLCLWAGGYAVRRWRALAGVLACMLLTIVFDLLKPWPMKFLVDYVLKEDPMPEDVAGAVAWLPGSASAETLIAWCVAATVILFLLANLLHLLAACANLAFGQRMTYDLATDLFGHLQRLSLRFHSRHSVGDSIRRVTSDCGCVAVIVRDALLPVLSASVSLAVMFVILFHLDQALALLSLLVVPFMIVILRRYAEPMLERSYEQHDIEGKTYEVVEQTLSAIPVVQAFGREEHLEQRLRAVNEELIRAALAANSVQLKFKVLMGLTTALGTAAILWIGADHVLNGNLTVGSILVFLSYLASLYGPLESLMYTSSTFQGAAGSARRVLEVLATQQEVVDSPAAVPLTQARGHLVLEDVTFGYEADRPILHGISLEVLPGQVLALVGATGAGKSTLVSLIPRFFDPWQGRVLLDGHDLRQLQLKSLRRQVALVLQEPFLFPLSVAENIAYGRPEASREEIEAAARAANAHEFILGLPEGYETRIGERGATLSGGERQRVSIARAFLMDTPILILDEPTSALDAGTEKLLLDALSRLLVGRTTLIIAHRLSTVRNADRIIVIHEGKIIEEGTHQELLLLNGRYAHLHDLQVGLSARRA